MKTTKSNGNTTKQLHGIFTSCKPIHIQSLIQKLQQTKNKVQKTCNR